jgi:hypothetical protein
MLQMQQQALWPLFTPGSGCSSFSALTTIGHDFTHTRIPDVTRGGYWLLLRIGF